MEEELHYPCGENKGADQLRGYHEADLRLCFRICKKPVFSRRGSFFIQLHPFYKTIVSSLAKHAVLVLYITLVATIEIL